MSYCRVYSSHLSGEPLPCASIAIVVLQETAGRSLTCSCLFCRVCCKVLKDVCSGCSKVLTEKRYGITVRGSVFFSRMLRVVGRFLIKTGSRFRVIGSVIWVSA